MSEHPKVFISYSHQNVEYENKILEFANRLRSEGIDANIVCMRRLQQRDGHVGWKIRLTILISF